MSHVSTMELETKKHAAALLMVLVLIPSLHCAPPPTDESESSRGVEVEVTPLRRAIVRAYVRTYGTVEAAPAGADGPPASAAVASQVEGVVSEARASEGLRVAKGSILFDLDARTADAAIAKAEVELDYASKTLARRTELIGFDGTSRSLLEQAERDVGAAETALAQARTDRNLLEIRAPLAGTVVRVLVRPGESVRRDSVLCEIVDLDRLVATMQVPAAQVAAVRPGQLATVFTDRSETDAKPTLSARVNFVGSAADPRTATVPVRVSLPPGSGLSPGSLVDVRVVTEERENRLVVPVESLVTLDGETTLARVEGTTARRVPVRVGLIDGEIAEIDGGGLEEGMSVVTVGAYGLPDGAAIRVRGGETPR